MRIYRVLKLGPNFDAPLCGFQVNWPIWLLMSRHLFFVAISVVFCYVVEALFGHDLSSLSLGAIVVTAE